MRHIIVLATLAGCGEEANVLGGWDGTEIDEYTLLRSGGIADGPTTLYPAEEMLPVPDPDGIVGAGERFSMEFGSTTVDLIRERYDLFEGSGPEITDRAVETFDWRSHSFVRVALSGDFDGDRFDCNLLAGPDTLVCNLEDHQGREIAVTSSRLSRR